ncbi:WD40-repeat-containing domain protein [Kickxella alabastrina]|uniref:WD40-repeat-containing domain protein n=1 Tax=Kickxella alabastrina TaxID=61397 RepID=UPI00222049AB|nr:WD40-repeat-containing domain protein [Kickxella alabastrina]KAI7828285.1 WD40-repeat-containing domain protein [Kickxella alabastrina]
MSFKLSAVISGHTSDVRGLATQGSNMIVSVSRDKTGRISTRLSGNEFTEEALLLGHTGFVNSTTVLSCITSATPHGLIATGGSDKVIYLWDPASPSEPQGKLEGHTDNVCALAASSDGLTLVSGSWDKTARVWVDGRCQYVLRDHEHAVWCVVVLQDGSVLTGSADKVIRLWRDGQMVQRYEGHTDCVRALVEIPGGGFASAGNDSSVRVWSLDGTCEAEMYGHTSFVYSLSALPDGGLVSGGEDRSVRVWRGGKMVQAIMVPATSVWAVAVLENGDVACGTSDGVVRVFSTDPARAASAENLTVFEAANASFAMSKKTMGNIDTSKLPGPERLEQPGNKDQQVIMVKTSGSSVEAYQWDQGQWNKVGEVVDAIGQTQKQLFDGKEYDYVFDVDIQEGMPPLKLPFNVTENPYMAAQKFLERNELSLDQLDTVANFIIKNTDGVQLGSEPAFGDPFTGSSRYVPGGGQSAATQTSARYADPFTGGNRYVPGGQAAVAAQGYAPPSEFVINRQGNVAGIMKKLGEFNAEVGADLALNEMQIQGIQAVAVAAAAGSAPGGISTLEFDSLLRAATQWPEDKRFPALDLIRLIVGSSSPDLTLALLQWFSQQQTGFIDTIGEATGFFRLLGSSVGSPRLQGGLSKSDEINLMMCARAYANGFSTAPGADLLYQSRKRILDALDNSWITVSNKNLVSALAIMYLNYAVMVAQRGSDDDGLRVLSAAARFLECTDNADAQVQLLGVFGVLAKKFQLCRDSARVLGDERVVVLGIQGATDAVRRAAKELGSFLST